ncbi:hypothetical protein BPTFM16_02126 [Altererythrobacter insulae]|nr:hypothetical protein BPTFM16_02126 [Altererythrobacter insulae]
MSSISDNGRAASWLWLALLATIVAMLGGSSRADAMQNVALRPLLALLLVPTLYYLTTAKLREARFLLVLLGLLGLWVAIQIIPLPPSLWQALPERNLIAELDQAVGLGDAWRPISMVPTRGWNALAGFIVPVTAFLAALAFCNNRSRLLLLLLAALGIADALLGVLQALSGSNSALYFYAVTNEDSSVGIFANENHSAVFSAIAMLIIARLGVTSKAVKEAAWLQFVYPPAFLLVLLSVLVSGSRGGLIVGVLSLVSCGLILLLSTRRGGGRANRGRLERWLANHPRTLLGVFGVVIFGLIAAFFALDRAPGLEDILAESPIEDLRIRLWPVLEGMIGTVWIAGVGFGAFEEFYHIYEPTELLLPSYVNNAHNDWAQFVIEGGIPAVLLLVALLGWVTLTLRKLLQESEYGLVNVIFWGAIFAIISAASVVDYPLRTPTFQLIAIWLLVALAMDRTVASRK